MSAKLLVPSLLLVLAVNAQHEARPSRHWKVSGRAPQLEEEPAGNDATATPDDVAPPAASPEQVEVVAAAVPEWFSLGCYTDNAERTLPDYYFEDPNMTNDLCIASCASNGYSYAGTQWYRECFCSNSIGGSGHPTSSSECNTPCEGSASEMCGGGYRLSIYAAEEAEEPVSEDLPSGWTLDQACVEDMPARILSYHSTVSSVTPAACASDCASQGYSLAGVQNGSECWCGASYSTELTVMPVGECGTPCNGDSSQSCGGPWRSTTYKSDAVVTPSEVPEDWSVIHACAVDTADRLLQGSVTASGLNAPGWCVAHCLEGGFSLAAVEYGVECMCANELSSAPVDAPAGDCNMPCAGDASMTCGAGWRATVYGVTSQHGGGVDPGTLPLPAGGQVISRCVKPNHVAVTFDDGPYAFLNELSDFFTAVGGKATFYFNGNNYGCIYSDENVANIQYAYAAGHEMASHTWAHKDLASLTKEEIHYELAQLELALERIVGVTPAWIRPPFGSYNDLVVEVCTERQQGISLWDYDSFDYLNDAATMLANYDTALAADPENILILHHETHEHTSLDTIPFLLEKLVAKGYDIVTVSECLGTGAYLNVGTPGVKDASWTCSA